MATSITKTEMLRLYEAGVLYKIINTGNRIYAHVVATEDEPTKVVYCQV